jgi:ATP-dependent DNA helicase PIF1
MEQDVNNEPNLPVAEGSGSNLASTDAIELSKEQNEVVAMCERGKSVFFTGSAGTGKSVCLRHIIRRLREQHGDSVFVTASTGTFFCGLDPFTDIPLLCVQGLPPSMLAA